MDDAQRKAIARLDRMKAIRLLPDLVGNSMPHASKRDYGNRVSEEQRTAAPVTDVPIAGLHSVQEGVYRERVRQYLLHPEMLDQPGRRNRGGYTTDVPIVVEYQGKRYLHDGHHRVVAARMLGEDTVRARVVPITRGQAMRAWAKG